MKHTHSRSLAAVAIVLVGNMLAACATVKVNPLPEPPPTSKLRVYVAGFTLGPNTLRWSYTHDKWVVYQKAAVEKILIESGMYEVVNARDIKETLREQDISYAAMAGDNWALAREIGRAMHADYVQIVTRDQRSVAGVWTYFFSTELVNVESSRSFKVWFSLDDPKYITNENIAKMNRENHREMFKQAKSDMLSVAIRKGRSFAPAADSSVRKPPEVPSAAVKEPSSAMVRTEPAPVVAVGEPKKPAEREDGGIRPATTPTGGSSAGTILVVYDMEAPDQYRTVALIVSEALREELFRLKRYVLVSRENLQKVLEEMALQQSGLVDERLAVKAGRGLAANQIITGQIGLLGKTFVIQAKRIDVESLATVGLASAKFTIGQEDEVLNMLPDLAKGIAGLK
jgi:curli biogenesis system outer membrane secretion channel CsgG